MFEEIFIAGVNKSKGCELYFVTKSRLLAGPMIAGPIFFAKDCTCGLGIRGKFLRSSVAAELDLSLAGGVGGSYALLHMLA